MKIRWYGQSTFALTGPVASRSTRSATCRRAAARGIHFDYPPIEGLEAELLLVTHEHGDHKASRPSAAHRP